MISAVTGVVAPAMATGAILSTVPDISGVSGPSITEEIHTTTLSIVADDIVLKVGNLAFTGVQLVGRTVDAVVEGTMTLQALQYEIIHKSEQTSWNISLQQIISSCVPIATRASTFDRIMHPLSSIPTYRVADRGFVERVVQGMAKFLGEEEFTLRVGKLLVKRSAEVGLRVDGVVKDSGIEAAQVIDQPLQDVHIDSHNTFALPIADCVALCSAVNDLVLLRRQVFNALKTKCLSDREAVEVLEEPGVKKHLDTMAQKKQKQQEKASQILEQFNEAESALAAELEATPISKDPLVDDSDLVDIRYKILIDNEDQQRKDFLEAALLESKEELLAADLLELMNPSNGKQASEALRIASTEKLNSAFSAMAQADFELDRENFAFDVSMAHTEKDFLDDLTWCPFVRIGNALSEAYKSYKRGAVSGLGAIWQALKEGNLDFLATIPVAGGVAKGTIKAFGKTRKSLNRLIKLKSAANVVKTQVGTTDKALKGT